MPVIVHTRVGVVREVFGSAVFVAADGSERPVRVGDVVRSGDVILTRQDSIVQIEQDAAPVAAGPASDTDRVISALAAGDPNAAPAAGLAGGDGSLYGAALRVDRINERFASGSLQTLPTDGEIDTTISSDDTDAPEDELAGGPGPTLDVDAPDNSSDSTPTINGSTTLAPGRIVTLTVSDAAGNTQTFFTTVNADGSFSADVPLPLAAGDYTVLASGSDNIGRVASDSDDGSIVGGVTPPVITVSAPELTGDNTPTLTGTTDAPAGSTVTLTITDATGAVQTVTAVVGADGRYSVDAVTPLADGAYGVVASVTTPSGTATANDNGVVDTTPPAPTITLDAITGDDVLNVAESGLSEITLSGRVGGDARPGDTVTVTVGGQDVVTTVAADGSFAVVVSGAALAAAVSGGVSASVTSSDAAGNSGTASVTRPYTLDAAPVAVDDSLRQPEDGPAGSGDLTPGTSGQDSDPEGSLITVSGVVAGSGTPGNGGVGSLVAGDWGSVTVQADGRFVYTPGAIAQSLRAGETVTDTFSYSIVDAQGNSASAELTVTLVGANDVAVIGGDVTGRVVEDGVLVSSGVLTVADADAGEADFRPLTAVAGDYGSFSVDSQGRWSYTLDNAANRVQVLMEGEQVTETFTVTSSDGTTRQVVVTVVGSDDAPVVSVGTGEVVEDIRPEATGTLSVSDIDSDLPSFVAGTQSGSYGGLALASNGQWRYTLGVAAQALAEGEVVTDAFTVSLSDGSITTVTITVTGTDDLPVVSTGTGSVIEDDKPSTSGRLTATDIDGPAPTFVAGTQNGAWGALVLAGNGAWTYTLGDAAQALALNEVVTEVFTVELSDGTTTTVTITVTGTDDLPVISTGSGAVVEDESPTATGTLTATDADNPALAFVAGTQNGTFGALTLAADGQWSYTLGAAAQALAEGEMVIERFTVALNDGSTTTVTITVTGTNDPAVIPPVVVELTETNAVLTTGGTLAITDPDSPLTFLPQTAAAGTYGSFTLAADGTWTYTASSAHDEFIASQVYTDTFTVTSADGSTSTVTINITGTNDPAVIPPVVVELTETNAVLTTGGKLAITDPDSPLTFVPQTAAAGTYGSFTLAVDGSWTYTASSAHDEFVAGQVYTDTFMVTSADGSTSTVTINITGTNDPAVIPLVVVELTETNAVLTTDGTLAITDPDSPLTFVPQTAAAGTYGSFTLAADGSWTYTASSAHDEFVAGQVYTDTFMVTSADGSTSTVTINITGTNDPAVIPPVVVELTETNAVLTTGGKLAITDPDSPLTFVPQTAAAGTYGSFTLAANGTWTYTASSTHDEFVAGQVYTDTFMVTSADGSTSTVTINITGTNDPAVIPLVVVELTETNAVLTTGGVLAITDPDSPLTFVPQTAAAGTYGSFTLAADGTWTYTASSAHDEFIAGQVYTDTFTVTSADGSTSTVTINITGSNDAPLANNDSYTAAEDGTLLLPVLANDSDIDSPGPLSVQSFTQPTFGRVTLNADGTFSYRADPDFYNTTRTFATVVDSALGLPNNVFLIHDEQVANAGDYMIAPPRSLTANSITTLGRLPDGDFIIRVSNGDDFERVVNVVGAGNAPDFVVTIPANSAAILNIGNVASGAVYSASGFGGTATVNNTALTLSTPAETFTYTVSDGQGGSATATVDITVTPTNDAPVARADNRNLNEDAPSVSGQVIRPSSATSGERNDTDKDGDALSVTGVVAGSTPTPPTGGVGSTIVGSLGTLVLAADGSYTYTPGAGAQALNLGQTATDVFTYTVSDGRGGTAATTLTLRVSGSNDAPTIDLDGDDSSGAAGSGYRGSHVGNGPVPIADADLRVADIDTPLLQRATVTLSNAQTGDLLTVGSLPTGISASLVGNVLTLTGAASAANYALALRAVGFDNSLGAPSTVDRVITVSVSDGNLSSNLATSTITVIDRNDTPVNTLPGEVAALEDIRISIPGVSVADPDEGGANSGFKLATVELSVSNGTLRLALAGGATISAGANDSAALTLSGSQAAINSTLASLSYLGNRDYIGGDTLVVVSSDGQGLTDSDSLQITVGGVNDAPSGTDRTVLIDEDTSYTLSRADFGFVDAAGEGNNLLSVTVTPPSGGALTLNGVPVAGSVVVTPAQLDAGQLVYTPAANVNGVAAAGFSFQVRDDGGTANGGQDTDPTSNTVTFDITPVNDAPVLAGGGSSASYIENGAAVVVNAGLTLGDIDNGTLASATVSIGSGFQAGADLLALVGSFGNIAGNWNAGTGVLTLTSAGATATLAQWQSALRAVTYANSGEDPGAAARSISFRVNDGQGANNLSNSVTSTVNVTPVNDAPTLAISQPSNPAFTEAAGLGTQGAAVAVFSGVAVGTVEAGQTIQSLTFTIDGIKDGLNEVLRLDGTMIALNFVNRSGTTPTNGMAFNVVYSGSTNNATATVTLSKTGGISVTAMQSLLGDIQYQNTNLDNPTVGDRTFTLTRMLDNGGRANGGVDVLTTDLVSTVRVVGVNDGPVAQNDEPPANAVAGTSTAVTGNAVTGAGSGNVADTDPENAVLRITGLAAGVTEAVLGTTAITAPVSVKGVYGTLLFNADGSWSYLIDNADPDTLALPGGGRATDVFSYTVTDGGGIGTGGPLTDTGQITIQVAGQDTLTSSVTPINPLVYGVLGEYFGYNDNRTGQAGDPAYNPAAGSTSRWHADDGRASSSLGGGVATGGANLESTGDALFVINGRNVAAGGSAVTGTPTRSLDGATDARWIATDFDYGFSPQVNGSLGSNPKAPGGSGASALPNGSLRDYIGTDINTLQITGGIGNTTDAVVRTFGYIYQPGGFVDFRVTADDGFTLFLNGVEVAQYNANQSPTVREFIGKELQAGMNLLEMVYWEQGGNARLRVEAKESGTGAGTWTNLLSLDNSALFQPGLQPVLTAGQDIVETATNRVWEIRTGGTFNGSTSADTVTGSSARDVISGNNGNDNLRAGSGADNVGGGNGNDSLAGEVGADLINGDNGNDTIDGGLGSDFLSGGTGSDIVIGGAGWDRLTGGNDSDTFDWNLADRGVAAGRAENPAPNTTAQFNGVSSNGSRAQDFISDFDSRPAASGGDVLDLRDLLVGESSGTLDRFLDFNVIGGATPSTEIRISSSGAFSGGTYNSAVEDQRIVLEGVDIRASLGLAANASDNLILQTLIDRAKLLVDA